MMVAAFLAAALLSAQTGEHTPSGAAAGARWFGIALGTAAAGYRSRLGDPLRVTVLPTERKARFTLAGAMGAFLILTERNGAVVGIDAFVASAPAAPLTGLEADPNGIRLGQTRGEIAAARPAAKPWTDPDGDVHLQEVIDPARGLVADYRFSGDRLVADNWLTTPDKDGPAPAGAIPFADPPGDSMAAAILDAQTNEREGVDWEYLYLRFHPCGGTATWRANGQSVARADNRVFDVVRATCPSGGATRTFFFDITSYFGKP